MDCKQNSTVFSMTKEMLQHDQESSLKFRIVAFYA
jgi:hypothetical protein